MDQKPPRILHKYDFADGGFVIVYVSRDVDAALALDMIENALPSLRENLKMDARNRKPADVAAKLDT